MTKLTPLALLMLAGCAGAPVDPTATSQESAPVSFTEVRFEQGKQVAVTHQLTAAQAAAQDRWLAQARNESAPAGDDAVGVQQSAIGIDTGCSGTSFWLYSGANQTGDRVCFSDDNAHPEDIDLSTIANSSCPTGNWFWCAKSYWGGNYFMNFYGFGHASCASVAPNAKANIDPNGCQAVSLYLGKQI